jgi:rod shape-determining protein MreC
MFKEKQRSRIVIVTLTILCFILVTLYSRESQNGLLHRMQRFSLDMVEPLQSGASKILSPVRDGIEYVLDLKDAAGERDQLLKDKQDLENQLSDMRDLERENQQLAELLKLKENNSGLEVMAVSVIGANPDNWEQSIQISAGYDDGVREWMAVLNNEGLVGRVVLCTAHSSMVQLITDDKSQVGARLQSNGEEGLIKGAGRGELRLQLINQDAEVKEGDWILASGSGGTCPVGIPIGTVTAITEKRPDLSRGISIAPAVSFSRLEKVLVVISPAPSELPSLQGGS